MKEMRRSRSVSGATQVTIEKIKAQRYKKGCFQATIFYQAFSYSPFNMRP